MHKKIMTSNFTETAGLLCELCILHDGSFTFSSSCLPSEDINYLLVTSVGTEFFVLLYIGVAPSVQNK